ncbi:MAG: alpha/beta fold hydrolase [Myxococcales bacterium]|nr:alpha/beta fold hydrolase [Myxococcales bacterium]
MRSKLRRVLLTRGIHLALVTAAFASSGCAGTSMVHAPASAPKATPTRTVILVHGMFVTPASWAPWKGYFEAKGYTVLAPAWPEHEGSAAEARAAHPDKRLAALDLEDVVDHYRKIIDGLGEEPILIGHSMGGLVVQRLLAEGRASAAVAIDAAPPKGVFTLNHAFIKSNGRILKGSLDQPLDMDLERFAYMFTNTLPAAEQRAFWEAHARPESRRVGRSSTKAQGKVDFRAKRGPLLLIGGGEDHAVPPVIGRKTWRRYRKGDSITEYHEFAGVDHWLIGGPRWQEIADYTSAWLDAQGAGVAAAAVP